MALINPHINFNGNAEEAFTFYKSVFGGEFAKVIRFKDLASPEFPVAEKEENKIMHIALPIGKSNMLMANDVPEIMGKTNENENRSKIVIIAESKEEADKLFNGLSVGGQIEGPIGDSPWGSYFGCFRDKYGIEWIVEFDPKYNGKSKGRKTTNGLHWFAKSSVDGFKCRIFASVSYAIAPIHQLCSKKIYYQYQKMRKVQNSKD